MLATGVTTREQLACRGGSNGGLLVGNAVVRRPDLWGAVVCAVPLLDMRRFNKLLAGASWCVSLRAQLALRRARLLAARHSFALARRKAVARHSLTALPRSHTPLAPPTWQRCGTALRRAHRMAEYGDPDTADWSFLSAFSPYHNIDRDTKYPPMLLTTSTRDDRVHPYHARAFVARLEETRVCDGLLYYENIEGGHGGAADPKQQAFMMCLYIEFLRKTVGKGYAPFS